MPISRKPTRASASVICRLYKRTRVCIKDMDGWEINLWSSTFSAVIFIFFAFSAMFKGCSSHLQFKREAAQAGSVKADIEIRLPGREEKTLKIEGECKNNQRNEDEEIRKRSE